MIAFTGKNVEQVIWSDESKFQILDQMNVNIARWKKRLVQCQKDLKANRGAHTTFINQKVTKTLKSKIKAREAVIEGIGKFKEYLHECWKERCERVIEWELQNNITNKIKRLILLSNKKSTSRAHTTFINQKVTKTLKSKIKAREAVIEGIGKFKEYLHECWKERCERVIEWELQNNITNKIKRKEDNIYTELNEEINRNRDS
ncbi:hypothetical protein Glove_21g265 [Diversispora epigaea]|uniref:Uncharacterized protein n=1 Tax=Diversispora epigaea TaxID=1348612 RepID=A0A397JMK0_9GLOM|nr:hypothetical protein Glove_21g265 [Diversispora epigaea]